MKQRSIIYNFTILIVVCFLSSCGRMAMNSMGLLDKKIPLKYISNGEKKIASFSIHHVGQKEFYDDVKRKIDSFIKIGYVVYYENVRLGPVKNIPERDTLLRKARKITGVDFLTVGANAGYIDTATQSIMGKKSKYIKKFHLVNQPIGIIPYSDTMNVKNVDATFVQLVNECEKKFGPIKLEKYDFETNFGKKYELKKEKEINKYFLTGFRNNLIANTILNDRRDKIIIVYGAAHFDGILENLQAADKRYKKVEGL